MPEPLYVPAVPFPSWVSLSLLLSIALAVSGWLLIANIQTQKDVSVLTERVDRFHAIQPVTTRTDTQSWRRQP